ncbi:MAG: apolipoprotein N-acyltransferase [Elusimicrobiales bacterium]
MLKKIPLIILPVLTSVLLVLAYPKFDLGWLAWVGLGPLSYYILKVRSGRAAALGGLLCGALFYLGALYWIYPTMRAGGVGPGVSALGLGLLALTLGLEFLVISVFGFYLKKAGLKTWPYVFAAGWLALEAGKIWLAQHAVWFPWFMLGHTQWAYGQVVQLVSVTGVYGLSAALCFTGALAGAALAADISWPRRALRLLPAPLLAAGIFYFGAAELKKAEAFVPEKTVKVALLQPSIDFYAKWDAAEEGNIKARLSGLLAQAGPADLTVWPENALPCWIDDAACRDWLRSAVAARGGANIVGSVSKGDGRRVSAYLLDGQGEITASYDKRRLVPFGEYVPLRALLGRFIQPVAALGEFEPGAPEQRLLELKGAKLGAAICYESIFPDLFAGDARDGADLFVNITNDGWYLDTAAPQQHFIANIFRAVETRRPVARAANNGISAVIDPWGRVLARTSLNDRTVLGAEAPLYPGRAFFPLYGHWFLWAALMAVAAFLLAMIFV